MPGTPMRPGTISFVAILLVILGCLSLLCGLTNVPTLIFIAVTPDPQPVPGQPPDGMALQRMAAKENATYYPAMGGFLLADLLCGIGQIVCGFGLLKMNPSRRVPAILVTLAKVLLVFGSTVYQAFVLGSVMPRFLEQAMVMPAGPQGQPQPMPIDLNLVTQVLLVLWVSATVIVELAIFLTITLILTSSKTKAAFTAASAPQPTEDVQAEERPQPHFEGYEDEG